MPKTLEGERRWTTVLFTDMVNFSAVSEQIGAENVYALLSKVIAMASDCISQHGGHLVDYAGDSILAAFGAPIALENASLHACTAARDFQQILAERADELEAEFHIRPQFRVGIAGGTVILGKLGLNEKLNVTLMGEAVNQAARLEALAEPGKILLSEAVFSQVEGFVSVSDLGEMELKGFAQKSRVYQLEDILKDASRFEGLRRRGLVDMVGREHELVTLLSAARERSPGVRVLAVSAPAGMGKSHLIHEFRERLGDDVAILLGQCNPSTTQVPFSPFAEILRSIAALPNDAAADAVADRLRAILPGADDISGITALLTNNKEQPVASAMADHMGDALRLRRQMEEIVTNAARDRKNVLVVEDAHWIDHLSAELIQQLVTHTNDEGILLIITCRPEYVPDWMKAATCTSMHLQPLSQAEIHRLIESRAGDAGIPPSLVKLIEEKAEGNPLFAEEIIRFLKSGDKLQSAEQDSNASLAEAQELLAGNLQHLVLSRVDHLPTTIKPLLHIAAAVGRRFSSTILDTVTGEPNLVASMCEQGCAEGIIEADPSGHKGDWRFTHALIRDAIYSSLLKEQQRSIHAQIAEAINANIHGHIDQSAEALAYHYSAAGNIPKAVNYLSITAHKSRRLYVFDQAEQQLEKAFSFIDQQPDAVSAAKYGELVLIWLRLLDQAGNFGALSRVADRLLPRMRETGITADLLIANTLCAIAKTHQRDYPGALELAQETLSQAQQLGDEHSAAWAKAALMRIYDETAWEGRETLERLAQEIQPIADAHNDDHLAMTALYLLSSFYRNSGEMLKAKAVAENIREFAEAHADRRASAYAIWTLGVITVVNGDAKSGIALAEKGLELSLPNSADANVNWALWIHGQVMGGDPMLAAAKIEELLEISTRYQDYNLVHAMITTKAVLLMKTGRLAEGWKILQKLMPEATNAGSIAFLKHLHLMRAEVLLAIAGLNKPAQTATGAEELQTRPKMGLRDILTAIYLRLVAKRMASKNLAFYVANHPQKRGGGYARVQIGLGVIAKSNGQKKAAEDHFITARQLAEEQNLTHLVAQADALLAK